MANKELYIGTATPKSNEVVWIRPLKSGGVALYAYVYNKWQVLKLVNGKGTLPVDDDEVIDPATPGSNYYTKGEIDEKIADILGIDADQIDELIEIITDDDTITGLLTELKNKANKSDVDNKLDINSTGPTSNTNGDKVVSTSENGHKVSYNNHEIENQGSVIRFKNSSAPNLFLGADDVSSDHLSVHRNQGSGISAFTKTLAYIDDIPSVTPQVQSDWNEADTISKAYILNKPTIPTKTSEITDDVKVYLSISSWVKVQGESVYTSSDYAADWQNKLYISSDSMDNYNTSVAIDSDNRLKAITQTYYSNYNRIKGYAPYAGTLVIDVRSDSQNSFSTHKWYIKNRSNNVDGAKQYSVNIGVGSSQEYIFYVEKGEFSIMTDAVLSPSSTIIFNSISLIPTLAGLEREASQYSPGYMSAADKTKLDGVATGATANIGTVTGVKINNTTKTPTSGTVDLGTVLTSTTDSVTNGSTTPITSGGVYTALQSYLTTSTANSTYEKKISFTGVSSLPATCAINTYYRITSSKTSLSITLPSSSLTAGDTIGVSFTAGTSITTPTVSGGTIYKQDGWANFFEANATYEIVALYDGGKWLVTSTKFNS